MSVPESIDDKIELLKNHNKDFRQKIIYVQNELVKKKLHLQKEKTTVWWNIF